MKPLGYHEGVYYWNSNNFLLAYETITGNDCETPERYIVAIPDPASESPVSEEEKEGTTASEKAQEDNSE